MRSMMFAAAVALTGVAALPAAAQSTAVSYEQQQGFERWKAGFRSKALSQGVRADVFDRAFAGLTPNPKILNFDRNQAEFTRPIWKYLESAVSASRVKNGREKRAKHRALLAQIEQRFGVDSNVVLGIWGLESAYGHAYGDYSIIRSLATLAFDGRRQKFAEEQIIGALKIVQNGDVDAAQMIGSWAGAMGHVQFIPTSFQAYAVDFTGDGRRDFWSDDPSDALGSAANYLARHGWRTGEPAFIPVNVPRSVDAYELRGSNKLSAAQWRAKGVTTLDGRQVPDFGPAAIIIPAGASGPAFMTFKNFAVIKKYNNADSYALGVAQLGARIAGAGPLNVRWPKDDRPLGRTEKKTLQTALTQMGFDTNGIDGMLGPDSRAAIRNFQRSRGMPADGYASAKLLTRVQDAAAGREALGRDSVRLIQMRLNERGFNAGTPDGLAGPQTRAAISAFQRAFGYAADGQPSAGLLQALGG
jgi:membrane-bound lytic murein transglycosylase B